MIEGEEAQQLRRALSRAFLPPSIERWQVVIGSGEVLAAHESDWIRALVLVERGTLRVECRAGGTETFGPGSLVALECLPLHRLRGVGGEVRLLAVRRATTDVAESTEHLRGPEAMANEPKPARRTGPKEPPPADIDAYLAPLPADQRAALQSLRGTIHDAVPEATEVISYSAPAFRHHGMLVSFTAARDHLTFHLMGTDLLPEFASELDGYSLTKGGVHFTPEHPIPEELVTRMVRAKAARNEAAEATKANDR
jgi:uncharacterized protein YdhG (YjbR/CyaY superfamily)